MSFFTDVEKILSDEQENIFGKPISEATIGVKDTVEQLVYKAGLPVAIAKRYSEFGEDEDLLYSSESYRDHFFHPFHTFLLGFLLLKELKSNPPQTDLPFPNNDIFLKKWLLASLWHDITYTAEKGPSWMAGFIKEKMRFNVRASQDWGPILSDKTNNHIIDQLSSTFVSNRKDLKWQDRMDKRLLFRTWMNKQIENWHDHGVLSSILLIREASTWTTVDQRMVKDCGLAISLHNFHKSLSGDFELINKGELTESESPATMLGRLNQKDYPLAFLLAYCDTAQEWGRPSKKPTTNYYQYQGIEVNFKSKQSTIRLKYKLDSYALKYMTPQKLYNALIDEDTKKFDKMRETWQSEIWEFYILMSGFNRNTLITSDNLCLTKWP